ncbi:NACHT domain-containing protein [Streptomyces sp. P01-B04]|uniref:NACHT domain-containing protein n=1 Tax=Streptomyces poriferorum TaxID=2798799 RepID=UPI001C5EFA21|nr:NACHT domain-containing protein [Streptomyces poriferorum]MBW5250093.1 NACHT domain-containing protein [Streptomyces poriferorum]MBW5258920.1 NACHT domain-containing protein [Streptomyces poriferorum]
MPSSEKQQDESEFEAEVLRISRALFAPENEFQGSTYIGTAERDGVFVGPDSVTIVECTVSGRKDKAEKDGRKLHEACLAKSREHPFKAVKGFFVTRDEPTAVQRAVIKGFGPPLVACSFSQLRGQLVDSLKYLELRSSYPFGSAREPSSGNHEDLKPYVAVDPVESGTGEPFSVARVTEEVKHGKSVLLYGDYGAGKSMLLRELHRRLAKAHRKNTFGPFPILLNLRDHQGQVYPVEALERHAREIGFPAPAQLVRAWRAGDVTLILDGFDEIATPGWIGKTSAMRDIRRRSVELVRRFCRDTPASTSVVLAGRAHFFDSEREMRNALGARDDALSLMAGEPSEEQAREILDAYGWRDSLPDWLPSRPLLLSYLGSSSALQNSIEGTFGRSAGEGWHMMLDRISEREADMEMGVDGFTIRKVLERLATQARRSADGLGPISQEELTSVFHSVCGYAPDEGSYQLLQRLPGLGAMDSVDGSRRFVDVSLVDAARAGDVVACILEPNTDSPLLEMTGSIACLDEVGVDVAAVRLEEESAASSGRAYSSANAFQRRGVSDAVIADIIRVSARLWPEEESRTPISVHEVEFRSFSLSADAKGYDWLSFHDCVIQELDLTDHDGYALPHFQNCLIGQMVGVASWSALQDGRFVECEVAQFDAQMSTAKGILALKTTPMNKVMLTILKKVYAQRGTGRKESALFRGLDTKHRELVPDALQRLTAEGLITSARSSSTRLCLPVRGAASRVRRILQAPQSSSDSILE